MTTRIFTNISKEIATNFDALSQISPPKTRGDYIRLIRASIELLPARPPGYEEWAKNQEGEENG
ncbi:MAG: hypothetical protein ACHQ1H_12230 [Nitrososphaerales archaeon]